MKSRRTTVPLLCAVTWCACAVASDAGSHPAASLIPSGTVVVEVMEMMAPPRAQELFARFQESARRHSTWFADYVKANAKGGEPLPYHPNMGLTEDEYRELQQLSTQLRLAPAGQATLRVAEPEPGRFAFDGGRDLPELTGIIVDLKSDTVTTPLGVADIRGVITASAEQEATGPWSGISWKGEQVDDGMTDGFLVKFNVGRLSESGRGILYYDAKRLVGGSLDRATRVLTYDLQLP